MKSSQSGSVSTQAAIDTLLSGLSLDYCILASDEEVEHIMEDAAHLLKEPLHVQYADTAKFGEWMIPDTIMSMDMRKHLMECCETDVQRERVSMECDAFSRVEGSGLLNVVYYLVKHFQSYNIVWGVGRGSSVACYCFYLLGLHRVDSLEYDLDFNEFFKEEKYDIKKNVSGKDD